MKVVAEKEELLKLKHKEIEQMQDKVVRTYAEMENIMARTRREAENSKKFAIQVLVFIWSISYPWYIYVFFFFHVSMT